VARVVRRAGLLPILSMLLSVAWLGCSLDSSGGGPGPGTGGGGGEGGAGGVETSSLRVAHLAVGIPEVGATRLDFRVVNQGSFNDIAFGRVSQSAELPSGVHQLDLMLPGGVTPLVGVSWELEADVRYTVVAYRDATAPELTGLIVLEERTNGLAVDRGRVLVGHGADDSTWATVAIVDVSANALLASGLVLGTQIEPVDLEPGPQELGFSISSVPPAIDEGPFEIDVSAGETSVVIPVDENLVDGATDPVIYVLKRGTVGMIPVVPGG